MKCFHCGSNKQIYYCEKCFQELISKNMDLQLKVKELEKELREIKNEEYKPKHMKED